jgi:hypothetical protein
MMEKTMALTTNIDHHQKAYVCIHVFENIRPILLVSRPEGDWCFLCGGGHDNDATAYRVVGMRHILDGDVSLSGLVDLPPNWEAEREADDKDWIRTPISDEINLGPDVKG